VGEGVLISGFSRHDGALYCEGVAAETIAEAAGTPTFVYSAAVIRDRYRRLTAALAGVPHRVHYSLKANSSRAVLSVLRAEGSAVDVVSGGELFRAQRAGFASADIIFGGVGKTASELREALVGGIKLINVESEAELVLLDRIAGELGVIAPVGFRINPEVSVENLHHYISTGEKGHKFGIPHDEALAVAATALGLRNVALVGLDMHVGSQLSTLEPYRTGLDRLSELATKMRALGAPLRYIDIGGGLPVPYGDGDATDPDLDGYAKIVVPAIRALGAELIVEPGRFFAATSGVLLTRVLYRKQSGGKSYVIADAGMSELLRPSHYDAFHLIEAVRPRGGRATVDVVGPVCESGDFLALAREMDDVQPGDLLVIHTAGAYGYVMSSNYNTRPKGAEVMVDGDRFAMVTIRESYDDLVRLEQADPNWRSA
jgi:diaminopimelate decarboxylase